ncbi:MAG: SDR family NAD(P)-dependent oxidoreductase [Micrococcales bacterium]|nr:SDR family NAD(P)-dependent oxidoreductase [Micrococcales bacterium]
MKTIVVTGASDGIGAAAALQLASQGHHLLLVGRSEAKMAAIAEKAKVDRYFLADFQKLAEVRRLASELSEASKGQIDVLANNAGGIFKGPIETEDGFELTFQVNHLAGFLLTHLLMGPLLASQGAVINTSSIAAQRFSRLDLEDLNSWNHFSANRAYGNAKLANIMFTRGLHARFHTQGLSAVAFHPGNVATSFATDTSSYFRWVFHSPLKRFLTKPEQGGANLSHFAAGTPGETWISGQYYAKGRVAKTSPEVDNPELVKRHWEQSANLLGIMDDAESPE